MIDYENDEEKMTDDEIDEEKIIDEEEMTEYEDYDE